MLRAFLSDDEASFAEGFGLTAQSLRAETMQAERHGIDEQSADRLLRKFRDVIGLFIVHGPGMAAGPVSQSLSDILTSLVRALAVALPAWGRQSSERAGTSRVEYTTLISSVYESDPVLRAAFASQLCGCTVWKESASTHIKRAFQNIEVVRFVDSVVTSVLGARGNDALPPCVSNSELTETYLTACTDALQNICTSLEPTAEGSSLALRVAACKNTIINLCGQGERSKGKKKGKKRKSRGGDAVPEEVEDASVGQGFVIDAAPMRLALSDDITKQLPQSDQLLSELSGLVRNYSADSDDSS